MLSKRIRLRKETCHKDIPTFQHTTSSSSRRHCMRALLMIHWCASCNYLCIAKNKQKLGKGCLFPGKKQYSYSIYEHAEAALATRNRAESKCPRSHPPSCTNLLLPWCSAGQAHNWGLPSSFHERSVRLVSAVLICSIDFAWTKYKPVQTLYFAELQEWLRYISFLKMMSTWDNTTLNQYSKMCKQICTRSKTPCSASCRAINRNSASQAPSVISMGFLSLTTVVM